MAATTSVSHHRPRQSATNGSSHLSIHPSNNTTNTPNHHHHHPHQSQPTSLSNGLQNGHSHSSNGLHSHPLPPKPSITSHPLLNGTSTPSESPVISRPTKSLKGKAKADSDEIDMPHAHSAHPPSAPPSLPPPRPEAADDDEHSRKIAELDERELGRHWGPHLVPLQLVIQRTIAQVFAELQLVAET